MIKAIKELGEIILEKKGVDISNLHDILTQDLTKNGENKYLLSICSNLVKKRVGDELNYELNYKKIEKENASKDSKLKYLYRRGSSNGPNYTPTCLTTGDIEKNFKNKIDSWFKHIKKDKNTLYYEIKDENEIHKIELNATIFKSLYDSYNTNKEKILDDLKEQWSEIQPSLKKEKQTRQF